VAAPTLVADALVTLEEMKAYLGRPDPDPTQDDRLTRMINAASDLVMAYAGCEYKTAVAPGTARSFPIDTAGRASFGRFALQTVTLAQLDTDTLVPSTLLTTDYQLTPITKQAGVWRGIRIGTTANVGWANSLSGYDRFITLTGTWGYPAVPARAQMAVFVTVEQWYRAVSGQGEEFPATPGRLTYDVRTLLDPDRVPVVA
jgi:hypothetical protein